MAVIERRSSRFLRAQPPYVHGEVRLGDSRKFAAIVNSKPYDWVITSPPYYGMRTYIQDQWLRIGL